MHPFLERLSQTVIVCDGGMGTQLQAGDPTLEDFTLDPKAFTEGAVGQAAIRLGGKPLDGCNEILNFTRPDIVETVHRNYLQAGADMVETNTFGCTSIVLAEYEIPELDYEIALAAAKIARKAVDAFSTTEKPRFVCGAIGPGTKLISLGQTTWDEIYQTYRRAYEGLIDGGADLLLIETLQDLLMVKSALVAAIDAMRGRGKELPIVVQITVEQTGTMLVGSEVGAALNMLECFPEVIAVGMNCATGPQEMMPHIRFLSANSTRPISIQPNAGLPVMEGGQAVYKLTPEELANYHRQFIEQFGVAIVGGCCGTTPAHIRAVAEAVGGHAHTSTESHWIQSREAFPDFDFRHHSPKQDEALKLVGCSSLYQFVPYRQDPSYLIVGEKTNANGSKQFREMLAAENWEGLVEVAMELEGEGSHVLDVCTAYVGRDEERDMTTYLRLLNKQVTVPLMIDSTEANVVEAGLKCLAGKPIINSINFEDGEARTDKVLAMCRRYGAAVVALTIDETGMAKTTEHKVAVAKRLLAKTREHGLADHDVFIDCLTFTLGSGDEEFRGSAMATIDAIAELKSLFPQVNFLLGLSNVSFGLKPVARVALNSNMLHHCRVAGLNSAIVHFSKLLPENRIDPEVWKICTDLVFDRREYAVTN